MSKKIKILDNDHLTKMFDSLGEQAARNEIISASKEYDLVIAD